MKSIYFDIDNIIGKKELKQIKQGISSLPGIKSVSVNTKNNRVSIDYDNTGIEDRQIKNKIDELGFEITDSSKYILTRL